MEHADRPRWRTRIARRLQGLAVDADDTIDAAMRRLDARLGLRRPRYIATYRGYADAQGVELGGRVLANRPLGGPDERDDWWDNLLNTYRRFDSAEVAGAALIARFGDAVARIESDLEGYYQLHLPPQPAQADALWTQASIALADGTLESRQPVLQVLPRARIGILSDIDDTVLESSITHWKTAAQLTFLHNARTRKPLPGVAKLYAALQMGADHAGCHPVFYVSSSPWNLYDLLDDFLELNAIPPGPIFLRDFGLDTGKFINTPGHGHKLERARELIARMPQLRWVLLGDSGQADAELYAEAAREFGDRIAAIYIRDVDPGSDSVLDRGVDAWIERVAGTRVPMLRAADSLAIATHAAGIGLVDPATLPTIAAEVERDLQRPSLGEAALEGVEAHAPDDHVPPGGTVRIGRSDVVNRTGIRPFPVSLRPDAASTGDRHMQRFLPIAGLLLLAPLSLLAQDAGQRRAAIDANRDGVIERSEAAANPRFAQAFDRLDRNHDGRLTADERPMHRGGMHAGKRGHGGIERLDADHDGRISRAEFDAGRARRETHMQQRPARAAHVQHKPLDFAVIDANRDGFIVRSELRAYHERMRPQREAERTARFDTKFREADLNRDGKLGRVEVQEKMPRLVERFAWMDENHDGFLSRAELQPPHGR